MGLVVDLGQGSCLDTWLHVIVDKFAAHVILGFCQRVDKLLMWLLFQLSCSLWGIGFLVIVTIFVTAELVFLLHFGNTSELR